MGSGISIRFSGLATNCGLRRGGKAYYALDISNPDNPVFLWQIDKSSTGFSELGQSWSVPVITYIPGYAGGVRKPVLVFAAGYDVAKDDKNTVALSLIHISEPTRPY